MSLVFKDPLFDAQWLRAAGHGSYGGAEVGECFAAARRIKELDARSWFDAWYSLAETVFAEANKSREFPEFPGRPRSRSGLTRGNLVRPEAVDSAEYLAVGVALVWIVDPHDQTAAVYRANAEPELVNIRQVLNGEPHLPSLRVAAAQIFA